MRSLATLGGVLVLVVLAIAWKISNQVEAGQEPDKSAGRVTLGVTEEGVDTPALPAPGQTNSPESPTLPADDNSATPDNAAEPRVPSAPGPGLVPDASQQPSTSPPVEEQPTQPEPVEPAPPTEEEIVGVRYTVKEGDTLYRILMNAYGKANDALIDAVAVASDLDDPGRLRPGMELTLPVVPGYDAPKNP